MSRYPAPATANLVGMYVLDYLDNMRDQDDR